MTIWAVIITIAVCLLAAIQYALLRQVGVMLVRLGPGSARPLYQGPRQGEYLGLKFETLWKEKKQSLPTHYIFASALCPICESVRRACKHVAQHWSGVADLVFIYEGEESAPQNEATNVIIWSHPRLMDELEIRLVPYGAMTDAGCTVVAAGLISNASQLEALLETSQREEHESSPEFEDLQSQNFQKEATSHATESH